MPEELDAHKFLLEGMKETESIESIKGVARVYDSRIGNENTDRIYLFFPDLHIISRKLREKRYEYGFNHERSILISLGSYWNCAKNKINMPSLFVNSAILSIYGERM